MARPPATGSKKGITGRLLKVAVAVGHAVGLGSGLVEVVRLLLIAVLAMILGDTLKREPDLQECPSFRVERIGVVAGPHEGV